MSAQVELLLSRLDGVRPAGHGRWIARCPAHADRRPSLSIREGDSGAVLAYCFAGCEVASIADAIGLELSDLFPPRQPDTYAVRPRAATLTPLVATFERDLLLVHVMLSDVAADRPIGKRDRAAAQAAADRVWQVLQEARRVI